MAKPTLLTVDDDPNVLKAIERDLRSHYGENYRVLRADSGDAGLKILRELRVRNDAVALLLADQRMPQMTGVEFLGHAMELFPAAKRVLLTAYADTDAAIQAINSARIHHYLLKPWDPPEEHLYPVLDDLLEDWRGSFRPQFEGVRVLGTRWSPQCYAIRDFLARNQAPYQWVDVETAAQMAEVRTLVSASREDAACLPMVLFPDGDIVGKSDDGAIGGQTRPAHRAGNGLLRFRHRRRRTGGSGGSRLRCIGRAEDGAHRDGSARRPGGDEFAH